MGYYSSFFSLIKLAICSFLFVLGCTAQDFPHKYDCPFNFMFHTGDGFFDIGNVFFRVPDGPKLPVNFEPYGMTNPGHPYGRWSDGLTDIDVGGAAMGFKEITPYLNESAVYSSRAIVFAMVDSPVLERSFFTSRGMRIPSYAASLSIQLSWFDKYLHSICLTPEDCADKMEDSLFIFGDVEANDIAIPLLQGKTIEEARTYVPYVTQAQINAAKRVLGMGAARVIIPGNAPIGCFPYMLTKFEGNKIDDKGCLVDVNELVKYKNADLVNAINHLVTEFPDRIIAYADIYDSFEDILKETMSGPNKDVAFKACCGTGGEYNFDTSKFCGISKDATICDDPNKYIHWDGMHLTQDANDRISQILQAGVIPGLHCKEISPSKPVISSI